MRLQHSMGRSFEPLSSFYFSSFCSMVLQLGWSQVASRGGFGLAWASYRVSVCHPWLVGRLVGRFFLAVMGIHGTGGC